MGKYQHEFEDYYLEENEVNGRKNKIHSLQLIYLLPIKLIRIKKRLVIDSLGNRKLI